MQVHSNDPHIVVKQRALLAICTFDEAPHPSANELSPNLGDGRGQAAA
jgi:hypothetical protein